jgi:acetyl-CoA synthetase (ADP-forming)
MAAMNGLLDYHRMAKEAADCPKRPADLPTSPPTSDDLSQLLASYGIPLPAAAICATRERTIETATTMGFPVVLKGIVTDVTHKSDLGLVKISLSDAAAVAAAWDEVTASIASHRLDNAFTGVLVQEQVAPGLELIASIRRDPQFGQFVLVGAGGTLVELLRDVVSAPAPLSHASAHRLVRGLRSSALLDGWRGSPPRDVEAIVDALVRLSWLAVDLDERLIDLEINPLIVGAAGNGIRAVDLRATWELVGSR